MNKRGLSDIITNILIILIVLVAVGILWAFVRPFLTSSGEPLASTIDTYATQLSIVPQGVYVDNQNKTMNITVRRGSGTSSANRVSIILTDVNRVSAVFSFDLSGLGEFESRAFFINYTNSSLGNISSISIAPIFTSNGQETSGTVTSTYDVATGTTSAPPTAPGPQCGNGAINAGEQCDGTNLSGQSCTTIGQGFTGGTLSCTAGCQFNTALCTPICGNGVIDGAETCDQGSGNVANGDGCSSTCQTETSWQCGGTPSSCLLLDVTDPVQGRVYDNRTHRWWFNMTYSIQGSPTSCDFVTPMGIMNSSGYLNSSMRINNTISCTSGVQYFFVNYSLTNCVLTPTGDTVNPYSIYYQNFIQCAPLQYTVSLRATKGTFTAEKNITFSLRPCPADVNRDGKANSTENILLRPYPIPGNCPASQPRYCKGDFNGDGVASFSDETGSGDQGVIGLLAFGYNGLCITPMPAATCGDNLIDFREVCDTNGAGADNLNGYSCSSNEFGGPGSTGTLQCMSNCLDFDDSNCI